MGIMACRCSTLSLGYNNYNKQQPLYLLYLLYLLLCVCVCCGRERIGIGKDARHIYLSYDFLWRVGGFPALVPIVPDALERQAIDRRECCVHPLVVGRGFNHQSADARLNPGHKFGPGFICG